MNSIDNKCNELKWNYDNCFYSWLEDFVGNKKEYPEGYVPCEEQFKPYQACVKEALEREGIELNQTAKEVQEVCQRDVDQAKAELAKSQADQKAE